MSDGAPAPARYDFLLSRRHDTDSYTLWQVHIEGDDFLTPVPLDPAAQFDRKHTVVSIGNYLLEWGPLALKDYLPSYPYRLFKFDPTSKNPLGVKAVQQGAWPKAKFWRRRIDFGNPGGVNRTYGSGEELMLVPLHNYMLNVIPTPGRGTYQLWNFDPAASTPGKADPLPAPHTPQSAFVSMRQTCELLPVGNFVLDWLPETSQYWVWSFDPQNPIPLANPAIQQGHWQDIDANHKLVPIGDHVLDWMPADRSYRLWRFDAKSANPLTGPVRSGTLPAGFDVASMLTAIQPVLPIDTARAQTPGSIDFMRTKVKHVVYLMIENRSFDHVLGWLYEKDKAAINAVGRPGPFNGASADMFNIDPTIQGDDKRVFLSKYKGGKLSDDWDLDFLTDDPYHDNSDVLRQLFHEKSEGYAQRATPNMGGFVWNNGVKNVMMTYTPEQLPVLNGLAENFAVSDEWFASMPAPTDPNRAFAFTGSALQTLNNFQNGNQYLYWPFTPRRPSIWKVLWSNGFTDWKIYNSVKWQNFAHTYHLFLEGQLPSVDANISSHIAGIDEFKKAAREGTLPAFSMLEPIWISLAGTSSYHPGGDLVPGERGLNDIYEALSQGPNWNETMLIITFDEHGGLYDHVPPPYAENPWPNDVADGFRYDLMGVRVPAIVVSPWIRQNTVFRSPTPVAYDLTSILATLLEWYGIPKSRWGLGLRVENAPTFEGILQLAGPRNDTPSFKPPYDKAFPHDGAEAQNVATHDLHRLITPWLVAALAGKKLSVQEVADITDDILANAHDVQTLHAMIDDVAKRVR